MYCEKLYIIVWLSKLYRVQQYSANIALITSEQKTDKFWTYNTTVNNN